jgi:hypothetical protein
MIPRLIALLLVLGCARSQDGAPAPTTATEDAPAAGASASVCQRLATVTVHVVNRSAADVAVSFGGYSPARAASGRSRTTCDVSRPYLQRAIRLRIARGGLQVGRPARVATEPVVCNDATLIIGAEPTSRFFYGAPFMARAPRR